MIRALALVLVFGRNLLGLVFCFVSISCLLVVTVCVAPLLMFLDWRDRRRGVPETR